MAGFIICGCPYTGMQGLRRALAQLGHPESQIVGAEDVTGIGSGQLWIRGQGRPLEQASFGASFVRYPYDLIPPNSSTFERREETEWLKTIALAFDDIAVNRLTATWALRNRNFGLMMAERFGVRVPTHRVVRGHYPAIVGDGLRVVKALGNCYVAEELDEVSPALQEVMRVAEDDGDTAVIFPASVLSAVETTQYVDGVGVAFLQDEVSATEEFRCYLLGDEWVFFRREESAKFDKSPLQYTPSSSGPSTEVTDGLTQMSREFGLGYLCADVVVTEQGLDWLIDVNPYGSMPSFDEFPDVSLRLASLMLERL